jgi:sulfate adenylyltransferase subunit 2
MDLLSQLESESIFIIREAFQRHKRLAVLWSMGKDSTALLWMCRKAFFGRIPFPVIHLDTGRKFDEMYRFRDRLAKEWSLDLVVRRNEKALAESVNPERCGVMECCHALKTLALKQAVEDLKLEALMLGIRRDEHGIRAKERYFSPRDGGFNWDYANQPPELWNLFHAFEKEQTHTRVHPLLHMSEPDVWHYIEREQIPFSELYLSRNGQRYRSIGCKTCCKPISSDATSIRDIVAEIETSRTAERSGRAQDKEDAATMERLRSLGYM